MEQVRSVMVEVGGDWVRVQLTDGRFLSILKSEFKPSGTGLAPDFSKPRLVDHGFAIGLGEYEASTDSLTKMSYASVKQTATTHTKTAKGAKIVIREYNDCTFDIIDDDGQLIHYHVSLVTVLAVVKND